jgi:hypothetical protein
VKPPPDPQDEAAVESLAAPAKQDISFSEFPEPHFSQVILAPLE